MITEKNRPKDILNVVFSNLFALNIIKEVKIDTKKRYNGKVANFKS